MVCVLLLVSLLVWFLFAFGLGVVLVSCFMFVCLRVSIVFCLW